MKVGELPLIDELAPPSPDDPIYEVEVEEPKPPSRFKRFMGALLRLVMNVGVILLSIAAIFLGYRYIAPQVDVDKLTAMFQQDSETAQPAQTPPEQPIPVRVAQLEIQDAVTLERQFPGQLEAGQTSQLAFEFGGYLNDVYVDEGDRVQNNQVLAVLDIDILVAERAALLASRDAIRAQLKFAETNLDRAERLQNSGTVSVDQTDQAIAGRDELVARVAEVEAGLLQIRIRITKASLGAPFDGFIGKRHLDEGNTAGAGEPVLTIFEDGAPRFRVGLPPDIDPAEFQRTEVEIEGATYPAVLRAIRPDIDPVTRMRTVVFDIEGKAPSGFGVFGTLSTTVSQKMTGAWVPLDAMRAGIGDAWTILIVDDENIARTVLVEPLYIGTDRAVVYGAFDDGDRVIVAGGHKVSL